jgi:hypothetical protein
VKIFKHFILVILIAFAYDNTIAQNVMLNILTSKSGIVKKGESLFLEVSVTNTNQKDFVGIYKLKIQISVPTEIANIDTTGHILPTGWKISSNNGSNITISNGLDMIAATTDRTILISVKGNKIGGPSIISSQLSFSDGVAPGTGYGSLKYDLLGDNVSTTVFQVIK